MLIPVKEWLQLCWWVLLLIPQTTSNQWPICSRSETVATLSSLTSPWACWCKPLPSQTADCSLKTLLKGSPDLRGPRSLNTLLSHRRASQFPCQATTFVCPLCNRPTERTHPRRPQRSSEEGVGSRRALNATQSPLCLRRTKGASESE